MKTQKQLEDIAMKIYEEMYKKATPSANIYDLIKKRLTLKKEWYLNYYLDDKSQQTIMDTICKKYKCNGLEKQRIVGEVLLGCSPTAIKK